jgi:hypothetical protein
MNTQTLKNIQNRKKTLYSFLINNLLLFTGILMVISGLTLQVGFHMGNSAPHNENHQEIKVQPLQYEQQRGIDELKTICGFTYHEWSVIHKITIVLFSLLMIYHFYTHWKWYKGVIKKNLINKNVQVIILSILFLLVALTGFIPWFIDLSGNKNMLRFFLIEIHDKLTLVLIFFLVLHVVKRSKWYKVAYSRLK